MPFAVFLMGTVNLNNLRKFSESKIRLLLVILFLKYYIIRSRRLTYLFLSLGHLKIIPFVAITSLSPRIS